VQRLRIDAGEPSSKSRRISCWLRDSTRSLVMVG
jgi:hypothetical protein